MGSLPPPKKNRINFYRSVLFRNQYCKKALFTPQAFHWIVVSTGYRLEPYKPVLLESIHIFETFFSASGYSVFVLGVAHLRLYYYPPYPVSSFSVFVKPLAEAGGMISSVPGEIAVSSISSSTQLWLTIFRLSKIGRSLCPLMLIW